VSARHAAQRRGPLLILGAAVLWGTVGVSAQLAYRLDGGLAPLTIGFYRLLVAAAATIAIQLPGARATLGARGAPRCACYFGAAVVPRPGTSRQMSASDAG
jgi:drug/metabolite transporter (DMT)-like permease